MGTTTSRDTQRRAMAWVLCLGMLVGLGWAGFGCMPRASANPRPITAPEAARLARVPVTNAEAGVVPLAVQLPKDVGGAHWTGHVDWSVPLVEARTTAADRDDALVQAVPGIVATRTAGDADAPTPRDGWTTRTSGATDDPRDLAVDIVASALLSLAGESADAAHLHSRVTWLDDGVIDGADVDAFRAPLLLGRADDAEGADASAEAVFWVDDDSRLRRIQFSPGSADLATIDFLLASDRTATIIPAGVLGGGPIEPRELSDDETAMLSGLRNRTNGGAVITMEIPTGDDELTRATGYVDWSIPAAYVAVDAPGDGDGLRYAGATGVAVRPGSIDSGPPETIPIDGWSGRGWAAAAQNGDLDAVDLMLYRIIAMTTPMPDDPAAIAAGGAWLRDDTVDGDNVVVVELRLPGDAETERGSAPFRYWVGDERLVRVEMRTPAHGFAHARLEPGSTPPIGAPWEVASLIM